MEPVHNFTVKCSEHEVTSAECEEAAVKPAGVSVSVVVFLLPPGGQNRKSVQVSEQRAGSDVYVFTSTGLKSRRRHQKAKCIQS